MRASLELRSLVTAMITSGLSEIARLDRLEKRGRVPRGSTRMETDEFRAWITTEGATRGVSFDAVARTLDLDPSWLRSSLLAVLDDEKRLHSVLEEIGRDDAVVVFDLLAMGPTTRFRRRARPEEGFMTRAHVDARSSSILARRIAADDPSVIRRAVIPFDPENVRASPVRILDADEIRVVEERIRARDDAAA